MCSIILAKVLNTRLSVRARSVRFIPFSPQIITQKRNSGKQVVKIILISHVLDLNNFEITVLDLNNSDITLLQE